VQTSFLKRLDALLYPGACLLAAGVPKPGLAPEEKALIVRPGGMGDLICADIALQELGRDARDFFWLIETRSQPWAAYRGLPHLCYDAGFAGVLAKIRGRHQRVINSEQLFGLAQATALLACSRHSRLLSFETIRGVTWSDSTVPYDWEVGHETISFARLFAAALDLPEKGKPRGPRPRVHPASAPPLVLIAGRQSVSRRLSLEVWVKLISKWHGDRAFEIAAAPEDDAFAAQLSSSFKNALRFTGPFDAVCERIARAEEFFTVDGGGVHIASYFGVPTLAIFTSGRDRKWHPLGEGSRILRRHDLPCQPCTKFGQVPPCPNAYACLKLEGIEPESAW
jgi:heptosyltransferase II